VGGSAPEAAGGGRPTLAGAGGGSRIGGGGEGRSSARSRRRAASSGGSGGSAAEEFGAPRPSWLPDEPVGADRHLPGAPGGLYGTRRVPAEDDYGSYHPDQPWAVAQGVSPVIVPAGDNARHDPGPNVIGYNR
jgi:hypothetical protein